MFFSLSGGKKKVLIVDDDPSIRRLIHVRLEQREKLDVSHAENGVSGLKHALSYRPDLVILDWMLPDKSGPQVLNELKKHDSTKDIPVLMLTGKNKVGDVERAFKLGANDYLTKPVDLSKLGQKVSKLLEASN